jgi:hypothetical protein
MNWRCRASSQCTISGRWRSKVFGVCAKFTFLTDTKAKGSRTSKWQQGYAPIRHPRPHKEDLDRFCLPLVSATICASRGVPSSYWASNTAYSYVLPIICAVCIYDRSTASYRRSEIPNFSCPSLLSGHYKTPSHSGLDHCTIFL